LRKELNAIKAEQFPWMRDVTKNAPQQAIKNLGKSYTNFFEGAPNLVCIPWHTRPLKPKTEASILKQAGLR
jgi:transposase